MQFGFYLRYMLRDMYMFIVAWEMATSVIKIGNFIPSATTLNDTVARSSNRNEVSFGESIATYAKALYAPRFWEQNNEIQQMYLSFKHHNVRQGRYQTKANEERAGTPSA